jgi:hypothetical protein
MTTFPQQGSPTFTTAAHHRERLVEIGVSLHAAAQRIGDEGAQSALAAILDRLATDAFRVMVVGDFKRGKSTFVNALLGANVLPMKAAPATAVITEVRWGDPPRARLWHEGSNEPQEIDPRDLIPLIVIDNTDPDRANPYSRAEVQWPIELCRNGVIITDSPGLDEHAARDEITLDELQHADAVIFLQHSIAPMSLAEQHFLDTYLEAYDPFFVFTYFDAIDPAERAEVTTGAHQRVQAIRGDGRDDGRFYFVDAKGGLQARIRDDTAAWQESGVQKVEAALELYLVTERHKAKIVIPGRGLRAVAREISANLPGQIALLDADLEAITRRVEQAQAPLARLTAEAEQIKRQMHTELGDVRDRVDDLLYEYLRQLAAEAPEIAENTVPDTKLSLVPWNVKERARAVAEEVALQTARAMENRIAKWVASTLEPAIAEELAKLAERMEAKLDSFEEGLAALRVRLTGLESAVGAAEAQEESAVVRFASGVGGFVLGGVAGGLVGARLGPKEALKTLLPTVLIYIAWLFTPLGLPILVAGLFVQAFWQGGRGLNKLQGRVQTAIGNEMATQIRLQARELARQAAKGFADQALVPLEKGLATGMDARLKEIQREATAALNAKKKGDAGVRKRKTELHELARELEAANNDLNDLIDEVVLL